MLRIIFGICAFLLAGTSHATEWRTERLGALEGLRHLVLEDATGRLLAIGDGGAFAVVRGKPLQGPVDRAAAQLPPDIIPHGEVAKGANHIAEAWLVQATRRYDHGVLGDGIEAGALKVRLADGRKMIYELGDQYVFEDLVPRLADMDGDGLDEVILSRSSLSEGAAVSIYRVGERRLEQFAVSPSIGLAYRWLNPIGAADFDADGEMEVAVVETPHLGKTLVIYGREAAKLKSLGRQPGYSSHFIGSTVLRMSAVVDVNEDGVLDIVVPDADRRSLVAVTFRGRAFATVARTDAGATIVTEVVVTDVDGKGALDIVFGRKDGAIEAILR